MGKSQALRIYEPKQVGAIEQRYWNALVNPKREQERTDILKSIRAGYLNGDRRGIDMLIKVHDRLRNMDSVRQSEDQRSPRISLTTFMDRVTQAGLIPKKMDSEGDEYVFSIAMGMLSNKNRVYELQTPIPSGITNGFTLR